MGYLNQFPNTHYYDEDLGFLIKSYKELTDDYNTLVNIYEIVKKDINNITIEQLKEWLDNGTLESLIEQSLKLITVVRNTEELKLYNGVEGQIVKTLSHLNDDNYGSLYRISKIEDDTTFSTKLENGLYANMIIENYFNVKQVDTRELTTIISKVLKNDITIDLCDVDLTCIYKVNRLTNYKNVTMNFYGSTIKTITPYELTHGGILTFFECDGIEVRGGHFIGNSSSNTHVSSSREWCNCINMYATTNFIIKDVEIEDFCGDGIEVGNTSDNVYVDLSGRIENVEIHSCHRNAISLLDGYDITIDGLIAYDITQESENPTSQPLCSIDCEPFLNTQSFHNVNITNVYERTPGGITLYAIQDINSTVNNYYISNCNVQGITLREFNSHDTDVFNVSVDNTTLRYNLACLTNVNLKSNYTVLQNRYKALSVNSDENYPLYIKANIFIKENYANTEDIYILGTLNDNSRIDIDINSGFVYIENQGNCDNVSIRNNKQSSSTSTSTMSDYLSNFKFYMCRSTSLVFNSSPQLFQEKVYYFTENCTLTFNSSSTVQYINTKASVNSGEILTITPFVRNGIKYYVVH